MTDNTFDFTNKEDQIMNEITEFYTNCESCQCCPEDDCVLFRIERIIVDERGTTKAS